MPRNDANLISMYRAHLQIADAEIEKLEHMIRVQRTQRDEILRNLVRAEEDSTTLVGGRKIVQHYSEDDLR